MKKSIQPLIFLLFLTARCFAQTLVTVDYVTGNASATTINLDGTATIKIINVPANLPNDIAIGDNGGMNITITKTGLTSTYSTAFDPAAKTITINIVDGKMKSPFPGSAIQVPLKIVINQHTASLSAGGGQQQQTSAYTPGYIYYDAVKLIRLKKENKSDSVKMIVDAYGGINNGFLKDILGTTYSSSVNIQGGGALSLSSVFSAAGNLNVTNFADGLAKFLVARSKEELNVAFFSQFKQAALKYPELNTVFPTTFKFLNDINAYQYAAMLPALRSAFQKDMNAIAGNLVNLRDLSSSKCPKDAQACILRLKTENDFLNNYLAGRSIIAALIIADNIIKGNNAADAINNLAIDKVCDVKDTSKFYNVANGIRFVDLISQSLRSTDPTRVWITKQQVTALINDNATLEVYLGLLYAKDQKNPQQITFKTQRGSAGLKDLLDEVYKNWNLTVLPKEIGDFKTQVKGMISSYSDAADNALTAINAKSQDSQNLILAYTNYASSLSVMIKQTATFLANDSTLVPKFAGVKNTLLKFSSGIDDATNMASNIKSNDYAALVLNSSALLADLLGSNYTFKESYIKYGTFMANIIQANNSDEVNAAIEAAVLPVGSASIKRETPVNISLNAYIGPTFGSEYISKSQNPTAPVVGITAPVGVAFSLGNNKSPNAAATVGGKSHTLFVSLIDVGALASYRLSDNTTTVASEIELKNIVSPGLFYYFGFGKCPISIGFGAQLGPQLRTVTGTTVTVDSNYYVKYGASIVVDIPFFNLYTKSKQ
ncbi:hypothetical protein ACFGVR_06225 [Mucilaginibacter sp. AW1-3]